MSWLDLWFDAWMICLASASNDAEEKLVSEYLERVAVSYPPPLVLNVEPPSDSLRFLELMVNTAEGNLSCQLRNPVVQALGSGERLLLRMPSVGGGTAKTDQLGLPVGTRPQDGARLLHTNGPDGAGAGDICGIRDKQIIALALLAWFKLG